MLNIMATVRKEMKSLVGSLRVCKVRFSSDVFVAIGVVVAKAPKLREVHQLVNLKIALVYNN